MYFQVIVRIKHETQQVHVHTSVIHIHSQINMLQRRSIKRISLNRYQAKEFSLKIPCIYWIWDDFFYKLLCFTTYNFQVFIERRLENILITLILTVLIKLYIHILLAYIVLSDIVLIYSLKNIFHYLNPEKLSYIVRYFKINLASKTIQRLFTASFTEHPLASPCSETDFKIDIYIDIVYTQVFYKKAIYKKHTIMCKNHEINVKY